MLRDLLIFLLIGLAACATVPETDDNANVENYIVVFKIHIDAEESVGDGAFDVPCTGALLLPQFILTTRKCLILVKSDLSNLSKIRFINHNENHEKIRVKEVISPKTMTEDIGLIVIEPLRNTPAILQLNSVPFEEVKNNDLYYYTYANVFGQKALELDHLDEIRIERQTLPREAVLPQEETNGYITLKKLPFNATSDPEVHGALLLSGKTVVGLFHETTSRKMANGKWQKKCLFTDVYRHREWVQANVKPNGTK